MGDSIVDYQKLLNCGQEVPGPRLNGALLNRAHPSYKSETNILYQEEQAQTLKLNKLRDMLLSGEIKGFINLVPPESPTFCFERDVTLNKKPIRQEIVYQRTAQNFHACLKREAKKKEAYREMRDTELVRRVCPRERITLYNYLKVNSVDEVRRSDKELKELINAEYGHYFGREGFKVEMKPKRKWWQGGKEFNYTFE